MASQGLLKDVNFLSLIQSFLQMGTFLLEDGIRPPPSFLFIWVLFLELSISHLLISCPKRPGTLLEMCLEDKQLQIKPCAAVICTK